MYEIAENLNFDTFITKPVQSALVLHWFLHWLGGQDVVATCADEHYYP